MITLPLGAVSTFVPEPSFIQQGQLWVDHSVMGFPGTTKPLDLADLACPTFGVGKSTAPDGSVETTYGAPYLPIIIPPKQLTTLDQVWHRACTEILSVGTFLKSFAIVDPPRILQPATALVPTSPAKVPAIETPALQPLMTKPNASPVSNTGKILPAATAAPDNNQGSNTKGSNPAVSKLPLDSVPNPDANHPGNRPSADPDNSSKFNPSLKPQDPDKPLTGAKAIDTQGQKLTEPFASNSQAVKTPGADAAHLNDPNVQQSSGPSLGEIILSALNRVNLGSNFGGIANSGQAGSDDSGRANQNNQEDPAQQKTSPQDPKILPTAGQAFTVNDPSRTTPPMPSKILLSGEAAITINLPPSLGALGTPLVNNAPTFFPQPGPAQSIPTHSPVQSQEYLLLQDCFSLRFYLHRGSQFMAKQLFQEVQW